MLEKKLFKFLDSREAVNEESEKRAVFSCCSAWVLPAVYLLSFCFFNHNILTALSPVKNLCVTVWRTDEEQTYCPFCSQIPVADVVLSALIASHADVLRLGTRDKPKKPKNVCVGGYCSYGPYGLQYTFLPESRLSCG